MKRLAILVCTHNREQLLEKLLQSVNSANRPADWDVCILVAANACTDGTHSLLATYVEQAVALKWFSLEWFAEPVAGKSFALNSAIPRINSDLIALIDDDHRVHKDFLVNICRTADAHPDAALFCGRILPDWDGTEPGWVREDGDYKIYPPPIPYFELGEAAHFVSGDEITPGGGNLFVRREVFGHVGDFSTDLGPRGHDLGGGEDTAYVRKALAQGERLYYTPDIVQYHYVDPERLKLGYLIRFAFQRTFAAARLGQGTGKMPVYVWRKLATYGAKALLSFRADRRRFYMTRTAAAMGEIKGLHEANVAARTSQTDIGSSGLPIWAGVAATLVLGSLVVWGAKPLIVEGLPVAAGVAALCVAALLVKSMLNFSRTGPQLKSEILRHYLPYSLYAFSRLVFWAVVLCLPMAMAGIIFYFSLAAAIGFPTHHWVAAGFGLAGIAIVTGLQFCRQLLHVPGSIEASSNYRMSRFYPLWARLTPGGVENAHHALLLVFAGSAITGGIRLGLQSQVEYALGLLAAAAALLIPALLWRTAREPQPILVDQAAGRPNILMIGADSLRSDRLGVNGNLRGLTPNLDALANRGTLLKHCYVPCARTAPSLASMLGGRWPHSHGIRDNFSVVEESSLGQIPLPQALRENGYRTIAISDWCGSDLGKFPFGFEETDLPEDQWNIRYLIRQGPKDIRLFLSLFTHNDFGQRFLPELYYLAGIPMTHRLGRSARQAISRCAQLGKQPFFINLFMSSTHAPFGSEYPYYTCFTDKSYAGDSKYVMSGLTEPFEVVVRQGQGKAFFDFEQILNLYDGCVRNFDNEVGRILAHLHACGLDDNTIVVIYSDHGMEFFERETWGQGNSVITDESAHIPLIIMDPRRTGGGVVNHITRSIDLAPTLLDLAGLSMSAEMQGVSLTSHLNGPSPDPELFAYAETGIWFTQVPSLEENHVTYPDLPDLLEIPDKAAGTIAVKSSLKRTIIEAKDRMIRTNRWKLVRQPMHDGIEYRLFDVHSDPGCMTDVSEQYPIVMEQLRGILDKIVAEDSGLRAVSG